jgi:hypothetical protein
LKDSKSGRNKCPDKTARQLFAIKIKWIRQVTVVELRQDKRKPEQWLYRSQQIGGD